MCLSLHLTTFHFLPLKAVNLTLQIVEVTTTQSIRAGGNGAEWYPGPQSCRHSWHLIRLLCVIVNQWCPFSLKIPIWCLPSVCWKGHNAQGVSCFLCLPLLLSWSCAAKSPSTDAASAPFTIRSSSGREEEEVRQTAAGPVCTKNKWLTDFFFSHVWSVSSGASCWKPQVVQEKLLLPPVPVSTSRQEVSLLGSPCALDKQQQWECNSLS